MVRKINLCWFTFCRIENLNFDHPAVLQRNYISTLMCSDHKWLYPLFKENESDESVERIFRYANEVIKIEKLLELLWPHFQNINAITVSMFYHDGLKITKSMMVYYIFILRG